MDGVTGEPNLLLFVDKLPDTGDIPDIEDLDSWSLLKPHGGGFIGGDKVVPGTPQYDHIGAWAVRNGWVGVPGPQPDRKERA